MSEGNARFTDHVAWITGGGAGIGEAVALRLASEGASVAILDVDGDAAVAVAKRCETEGGKSLAIVGDAADPEALGAAHQQVEGELGAVDILVNNVSAPLSASLVESDDALWDRVLDVGFRAAVRCSRLALPSMMERGRGSIVNIGSVHGHRGSPDWGPYSATKGALLAFTRQLAVEAAPHGVRVNAVTPGAVMTDLNRRRLEDADDPDTMLSSWLAVNPMGRLAQPSEIANAVAFVCSAEAGFMTGAELMIDGGESILGG